MRCCHVRKKTYLKKMTLIKFNLKKSYGVFGDILFQTATRLLKKKKRFIVLFDKENTV